jgi:hypothetical protein
MVCCYGRGVKMTQQIISYIIDGVIFIAIIIVGIIQRTSNVTLKQKLEVFETWTKIIDVQKVRDYTQMAQELTAMTKQKEIEKLKKEIDNLKTLDARLLSGALVEGIKPIVNRYASALASLSITISAMSSNSKKLFLNHIKQIEPETFNDLKNNVPDLFTDYQQ